MGWIWVVYGIGIKGDPPTWQVAEVITGDVAANGTTGRGQRFPAGMAQAPHR